MTQELLHLASVVALTWKGFLETGEGSSGSALGQEKGAQALGSALGQELELRL